MAKVTWTTWYQLFMDKFGVSFSSRRTTIFSKSAGEAMSFNYERHAEDKITFGQFTKTRTTNTNCTLSFWPRKTDFPRRDPVKLGKVLKSCLAAGHISNAEYNELTEDHMMMDVLFVRANYEVLVSIDISLQKKGLYLQLLLGRARARAGARVGAAAAAGEHSSVDMGFSGSSGMGFSGSSSASF